MMARLSLQAQHIARNRFKYFIVIASLIFFVSGIQWIFNHRERDIFMSSYHGSFKEGEHKCQIKVNVTFDEDDKMTFIKMTQDKNECSLNEHFVKAESYAEFKTLTLQKQTFAKANIKGFVQFTSSTRNFNESRFMPVTLQRSHGQLVLIISYKDIFPLSEIKEDINDKLVFILTRDR